jgi:hypothetical protein
MGFHRKMSGQQGQIDAAKENTAMQERAAKQAAEASAAAAQASVQAAADQQRNMQERAAIEEDVRTSMDKPIEQVDVQLNAANSNSSGSTKRRRAQFGRNYGSGSSVKV